MQFLRKIFDFYVFSNIHVAFAGFCMAKITLLTNGCYENIIPLFVALSIIVSYNFIRFYEIKTNRLGWLKPWFFSHKSRLLFLTLISISGIFYLLFFTSFNLKSLLVLLPFGFMTFFYVVPMFKVRGVEVSFRNFPGIKIFSIAIAWAGITVLFPLIEIEHPLNAEVYIEFLQRILILIVITLPFDIRDVHSDSKELKTLPQVLGTKNSKILGTFFLLITILLELIQDNNDLIVLVVAIVTGLFLWFTTSNKSRYYTGFWVEAIPVFWLSLMLLF